MLENVTVAHPAAQQNADGRCPPSCAPPIRPRITLSLCPPSGYSDDGCTPPPSFPRSFQYDSGCPLRTSVGSMEGEFQMWVLSEADGEFKEQFDAKIERFKLSISEH